MEESVKKEAEHDEWLRKFQESTKINLKIHDEIIQNLKSKGLPLYTHFYYSPVKIEYFSADSSFSNKEETEELEKVEELAAQHEPSHKKVTPSNLPMVSYYVAPYKPPISFPRRLEQHAEEALVHNAMKSLKKIKVNRSFLKEIRKADGYAKILVLLEVGNQKVIFKTMNNSDKTLVETVCAIRNEKSVTNDNIMKIDHDSFLYNSESCLKPNEFNYLLVIDPDIFSYEVKVQDSHNQINYECGKLDQVKRGEMKENEELNKECDIDLSSASCDPYNDQCDGGDVPDNTKEKCYWCCLNDNKRIDVAWEGLRLNDWIRVRYGKECKMTKERILKDYWRQEFNENQDDRIDMNANLVQEISLNTKEDCEGEF
nr:hypothetical protein [Tanacetum cinerariifolium]